MPAALPLVEEVAAEAEPSSTAATPVAFDNNGLDRLEFLVSMNEGEPLRPLSKVASGGETARLMLAMKSVLGASDEVPILVFDEVDAGVGGRSGGIIGEKLAELARHHQVLCITHLPQVASFAERHIGVAKSVSGGRSVVVARVLDGREREEELALMLGGATDTTRLAARELLDEAARFRRGRGEGAVTAGPRSIAGRD